MYKYVQLLIKKIVCIANKLSGAWHTVCFSLEIQLCLDCWWTNNNPLSFNGMYPSKLSSEQMHGTQ